MKYCYSFYCEVRTTAPKCSIIRDQVVPERLYLSDNRHATVIIPPGQKPFRLRAKSKGVVVIAVNSCVFVY